MKQLMIEPSTMKCCKDKNKWADKYVLVHEIERRGRCVLCQSVANLSDIKMDQKKLTLICGLRSRVLKTYKRLHESQKKIWGSLIDEYFGNDYTRDHLEKGHAIKDCF